MMGPGRVTSPVFLFAFSYDEPDQVDPFAITGKGNPAHPFI